MRFISEQVERLKSGDQAALKECMVEYQDYVFSVLCGILTKEEAEEAAQDTFLKVFKSVRSFNGESKFSTWIYRIAYRTGLDYLKKRKTTDSLDASSSVGKSLSIHAEGIAKLEKADLNNQIESALGLLNEDYALLLRLFYLSELNLKEVAQITGLSEANVKVRLFRARVQLRKELKNTNLLNR